MTDSDEMTKRPPKQTLKLKYRRRPNHPSILAEGMVLTGPHGANDTWAVNFFLDTVYPTEAEGTRIANTENRVQIGKTEVEQVREIVATIVLPKTALHDLARMIQQNSGPVVPPENGDGAVEVEEESSEEFVDEEGEDESGEQ